MKAATGLASGVRDYDLRHMPVQGRGEAVGNLWADRPAPLDWLLHFRDDVDSESLP